MTKFQALQKFFSSFGIPAIEENSFYSSETTPDFPYITYPIQTSFFLGGECILNPSVWYKSYSLQEPEKKIYEISQAIGAGQVYPCEDGYLWVKRGSPFCIPMDDPSNKFIKRMYLNIIVEYLTKN